MAASKYDDPAVSYDDSGSLYVGALSSEAFDTPEATYDDPNYVYAGILSPVAYDNRTATYDDPNFIYDSAVVNVTVSPAAIAGTTAVLAVTVTEGTGVTVSPATVAATSGVGAVTVTEGQGVTVSPATIVGTVSIEGSAGTTIGSLNEPDPIAATAAVGEVTVTEGVGVTVSPATIAAVGNVPDLGLASRVVMTSENILPQVDVVPYHVNDPARRLARFRTPGARGRNVFILTTGSVTTRQPADPASISRTLFGGHESPDDLTSTELSALIAAGYSVEVN